MLRETVLRHSTFKADFYKHYLKASSVTNVEKHITHSLKQRESVWHLILGFEIEVSTSKKVVKEKGTVQSDIHMPILALLSNM